ncbi:MAG: ABC transporter permease [Planctomycetota bacterium]
MIDRPTYLVARREFIENARTKTFWIGIISLPVIIAISIGISALLKEAKGEKTYLVLDRTEDQWVSQAIEETSIRGVVSVASELAAADPDSAETKEKQAELSRRVRERIASLAPDHPMRELIDRMQPLVEQSTEGGDGSLQALQAVRGLDDLPEETQSAFFEWMSSVSRDPEKQRQMKAFLADLSPTADKKFVRKSLADLGLENTPPEELTEALDQAVGRGDLFAYFLIPENALESKEGADYVSENVTDSDLRDWYESLVTDVLRNRRITDLNLTKAQAASLREGFDFTEISVTDSGERDEVDSSAKAASFAPIAFVYLLWIAIFTAANMLLTNTVEEKSNRLIEVLLSSVSPNQLMTGKVLGIGATGMTIILTWVATALLGVQFVGDGALAGIDLTAILADPLYLGSFVGYFLAGYLLYGAILVAMGSVCNSLKEAQNLMQPVMMLLLVPLIAMVFVVQEPNGTVAKILTYVPLYTPFLMMNRAGGPPPTWEYIVSTIVILVSLWFAFRAAAKVFRVGILMTGKPPKVREVLRWLRAPVGTVPVRPKTDS